MENNFVHQSKNSKLFEHKIVINSVTIVLCQYREDQLRDVDLHACCLKLIFVLQFFNHSINIAILIPPYIYTSSRAWDLSRWHVSFRSIILYPC